MMNSTRSIKIIRRLTHLLLLIGLVACSKATVAPNPTSKFTFAPNGTTGDVLFYNQSEHATSYSWDFGDSQVLADTGVSVDHHYAKNGTYIVTLTATNDKGESKSSQNIPVTTAEGTLVFFAPSLPYGSILIYMDGTSIGTVSTTQQTAPACDASGQITTLVTLGVNHTVRFKNASGSYDSSKNVKISAGGTCTALLVP